MRECVITRSGGPDVLRVIERQGHPPGPGQIAIEVHFAGVNFADLAARAGIYGPAPRPPFVPGFEVSGVVVGKGEGVTQFEVGDRVLCGTRFGGYADEVVVDAARARRLPEGVSLEAGAALVAQYVTAWHALTESTRMRPGEWVLVHAVAGGVGTAAVQLCRELGFNLIGTASTEEKLAFARAQGAQHVINYSKENFVSRVREITSGRGVDVVLDANGGTSFRQSQHCLAPGGRLVVYGAAGLFPRSTLDWVRVARDYLRQPRFTPFELINGNTAVVGLQILLLWDQLELLGREIDALLALLARGAISPVIDQVFALEDAPEAHRYLHARKTRGKVLLRTR